MSEGNGINAESWRERFDRLEASHVKLMTDHEVFVAEQEKAWARHEKFAAEQEKAWARHEKFMAAQEKRGAALDARIEKLVSGIGAYMRSARPAKKAGKKAK